MSKRKLKEVKDYQNLFKLTDDDKEIDIKETLKQALDVRKFEIDLYWKRAIYFWTFIGLCFAGFFALDKTKLGVEEYNNMRFMLNVVGFVFSLAWFFANKGSKYWQENWERHISVLQDYKLGPLFRTLLDDKSIKKKGLEKIIAPKRYSVTNINQILSLFMVLVWFILLINSIFIVFNINKIGELDFTSSFFRNLQNVVVLITGFVFSCALWKSKHKSSGITTKHLITFNESIVENEKSDTTNINSNTSK